MPAEARGPADGPQLLHTGAHPPKATQRRELADATTAALIACLLVYLPRKPCGWLWANRNWMASGGAFLMVQLAHKSEENTLLILDTFRENYPLRGPRNVIRNADETRQLTRADGLEDFDLSLGAAAAKSDPPRAEPRGNTYLWVIGKDTIPAALETIAIGRQLASGVIKHTNLTGGLPAHCGGEAWFIADDAVIIGGSSGRYGPDAGDVRQLREAGLVFKEQGYRVAVLGMDETGFMATLLVGDPEWL